MVKILALSSSRVGNSGYLESATQFIQQFLGEREMNIGFIPFASVEKDYEQYGIMVQKAFSQFPFTIKTITGEKEISTLDEIDVIMVGGGNTFKLLHDLYKYNLMSTIRTRVKNGIPYIGWSAGANITGLTLGTTNDMPVIQPQSFTALQFFPFQLNPHYLNQKTEGFNGETRDQRLEEFVIMNPGVPVVGLPEGTALYYNNDLLRFLGNIPGALFQSNDHGKPVRSVIVPDQDLSFLL